MRQVTLDISGEKCPITFVKTKLLLETMASGEEATIRLAEGEALDNLPKSLAALGHNVLSVAPEPETGLFLLAFCKA